MKNILLLTPIYPAPDLPKNTPVVHYFTKEWVKLGYKVTVIHYLVNFPAIVHWAAKPIHKLLESKFGSVVRLEQAKSASYELDGVRVKRIPLCKYAPHTKYPAKEIKKAIKQTTEFCDHINFTPDVIISHWINPQLEIMDALKQIYQVPTCFVAHDTGRDLKTIFKKEAEHLLKNLDIIGYRCDYIKEQFESYFHVENKPNFLCYSGIPENYISNYSSANREYNSCNRIIYVGTLITRKYPAKLIPAVAQAYPDKNCTITYVGEGAERKAIEKQATKYGMEENIKLLGQIPREEVIKQMQNNDIFIMVSKNETFGLVYLEAMAAGCITIASKNEGFDGIIQNGINGFLCTAGDDIELASILNKINAMSEIERSEISENAVKTAQILTENNVATKYINAVENVGKN